MMHNIYDSPEKFGLEILTVISERGGYDFDLVVVWRRIEDRTLWWAWDSGCSCPSPFESHGIDNLKKLTDVFDQAFLEAGNDVFNKGWDTDDYEPKDKALPELWPDVMESQQHVREALNGQ